MSAARRTIVSARGRIVLSAALAAGVLALPAAPARSSSSGPDPGLAGVPAIGGFAAESTCTSCHQSSPLNPDARGVLRIEGLPEHYEPGHRYAATMVLEHPDPSRQRWGFQLTAVASASGLGAGDLVVTDAASTQRITAGPAKRQYLEHTADGTGLGETGGHRWPFAWTAPESDLGEVAFYGAGNASDMDGSKEGDWIYDPTPAPLAVVRGPGGS